MQRIVLNGQNSKWEKISARVPLGPLLFLIYINDISQNLESNIKFLADDTSLFCCFLSKFICPTVEQCATKNSAVGISVENNFQS